MRVFPHIVSLLLLCAPAAHAQRFSPLKPNKREISKAVVDARSHLPRMERVLCLLQGNCRFPQPQTSEMEIVQAGQKLRQASSRDANPAGLTQDVVLPSEMRYISPGSGARVRALQGQIVEITFFREPLSRRGVVVYGEKSSEELTNVTELRPQWRFGFLKN